MGLGSGAGLAASGGLTAAGGTGAVARGTGAVARGTGAVAGGAAATGGAVTGGAASGRVAGAASGRVAGTASGRVAGPAPAGGAAAARAAGSFSARSAAVGVGRSVDGIGPTAEGNGPAVAKAAGQTATPARATPPRGVPHIDVESTRPPAADGAGGLLGARSELRQRMRERRRLRMMTLLVTTLILLGALPLYFGVRSATRDPVFNSLDALGVPGWAATGVEDRSSGSRWCFINCRFRERLARSSEPPQETTQAYVRALTGAGWRRWRVEQCPDQPVDGSYTCWRRDEFTLDLWVRAPACAGERAAGEVPADVEAAPAEPCTGSTITIKVRNAITDQRGRPEPNPNPSLVGETPDPVLTSDPLQGATPTPS
jgi:hypothetical protein